ncbi:unnamed protein product [Didymodactylos carnosus]|uniref:Uncharacterized protein n=1 Tax=Didymodactylos carnosus TaxID=1234261 RepID=A0A815Z588_9BILA|nr:unnamed protein product [Didymodactylos carnosus]CAF1580309.1 unnamed protein product [Didymodactylos carnosus]CAF4041551.1 unnamed protein product [Didymodactylos carnosus]CAF4447398.1 unnamed protein product [Didymodactylos carnosus]
MSFGESELRKPGVYLSLIAAWNVEGKTVAGGNYDHDLDKFDCACCSKGLVNPNEMTFPQYGHLRRPNGICIDINDKDALYVIDSRTEVLVKYKNGSLQGEIVVSGGKSHGTNELSSPQYVTVDPKDGTLFISDWSKEQIYCKRHNNNNSYKIKLNYSPRGLALSEDHLFVADNYQCVFRYDKNGQNKTLVAGRQEERGDGLHQLNQPQQIFVDEKENVYIADTWNHRIMKWTKNAEEGGEVVAGGNGSGSNLNQLNAPHSVFVDRQGSIYIADSNNHRIVRWLKGAKSGEIIGPRGGGGNLSNQLGLVHDLAFDHKGNLYVSDSSNHRVQMFSLI